MLYYHPSILINFNSESFQNYVDKIINCKYGFNLRSIKDRKKKYLLVITLTQDVTVCANNHITRRHMT